jgi:cellulase/cellobiase CelA1
MNPPRLRRLAVLALAAAVTVSLAAPASAAAPRQVVTPSPTVTAPPAQASCSVTYRLAAQWATGFVAELIITNTGTVPIRWEVLMRYLNGQRITQSWNVVLTQTGDVVRMTGGWNSILLPGQSVTVGVIGTHTGINNPPEVICVPA